ncbi:MAG: ABC transporter permease subunit [Bacilli bacterium]|nr:ABC transporter permease subunit [Bacilli bacterium]
MSKLVYNELYKLFHKRSTKLYFVLVFLLLTLSLVIVLKFDNSEEIESNYDINYQQSIIDSYKDRNDLNDDEKSDYLGALVEHDKLSLIKEKGIKRNSPEEAYVKDNMSQLFYSKNFIIVYGYTTDVNNRTLDDINAEIDKEIKKLEELDPIAVIKDELSTLNKEIVCLDIKSEFCDKYFDIYKKVLEYRIEMNIPKSYNAASMELERYLTEYPSYLQYEKDKGRIKEEEKDTYNEIISFNKTMEYKIEHKLLTQSSVVQPNMVEIVSSGLTDMSIFIVIGLIMIGASVLSEEFEKGTVKLLLVKPFTRNKILISKIIASIIMIVIFCLYVTVLNTVSSIIYNNYLGMSFIYSLCEYNFSLHKVVEYNIFNYYILTFISQMIYFIMLDLIVICFSTLTTSTAISISFGFGLFIGTGILTEFVQKFKWIPLLPMYTSDMINVFFGQPPTYKILTLPVHVFFNIFYVILFIGLAMFIFKKKDIKNQ